MDAFLANRLFWTCFAAWFIAQGIKVVWVLVTQRKFAPRLFVRAGGMPSAHSAVVCALTAGVGRLHGVDSTLFTITLVVAGVVMYDATGVRRAVGIQAGILNRMMDDFFERQEFSTRRLGELVGHTPLQVLAGAALGIGAAFLWV